MPARRLAQPAKGDRSVTPRRVALLSWAAALLIAGLLAAGLLGRLGPTAMGIATRPLSLGEAAGDPGPRTQDSGLSTGEGPWLVTWVRPAGIAWVGGVRPGDHLLAVDGAPPSPAWQSRWDEAASLLLVSEGRGEPLQVQAKDIAGFPIPTSLSLLAVGGAFMLIGLLAWRQPSGDRRVVLFFGFCLALGAALALAPATSQGLGWALVAEYYALPVGSLIFAAFFHEFLKGSGAGTVFRTLGRTLMAGLGFLSFALVIAYPWVATAGSAAYDGFQRWTYLQMLFGFAIGLFLALLSYARQTPEGKEQLRIMVAGTALGFAPFLLLSLLPLALGGPVTVRPEVSILAAVLMPLGMAYAILRHKLMGIRHLVYRGTVYAVLFGSLYLAYATLLLAQRRLWPNLGDETEATLALGFVFLTVATFPRALALARGFVDRALYRDTYDYRATLERLSLEMAALHEPRAVAERVLPSLAETLNLRFAGLALPGREPFTVERSAGSPGLPAEARRELFALLTAPPSPEPGREGGHAGPPLQTPGGVAPPGAGETPALPGPGPAGPETRRLATIDGEALVLPLAAGSEPRGTLLLGPKTTGELFRPEDLSLLRTFAAQLAVALDNAHLVEALRELNHQLLDVVEEERRRIAADLHDGPLQELIALGRQIERNGATEALRQQVRELRDELRELASRLRPPVLDDLGLCAALEWLVQRVSDRGPLATTLVVEGIEESERLPAEAEVALFRVAQESLNNAAKHGGARHATVRLRRSDGRLELSVQDDGAGFDPALLLGAPLRGHYGVAGMRERVAQLHGEMEIESRPGVGTTVRARLPLVPAEPLTAEPAEIAER